MADAAPSAPTPRPSSRWWRRARQLAPWVIAGATIAAILVRHPVDQIAAEIARGDALAMVPVALGAIGLVWFTATLADLVLLVPLVGPIGYGALLRAKAAIAMLNALGVAANYGGIGVWVQRRFRCAPATAAGLVAMVTLSDLAAISLLASAAVWLGGDGVPPLARERVGVIAPAIAAVTLTLLMLGARRGGAFRAPWREIPRRLRLAGVAARCGTLSIMVLAAWVAARAFGLAIPFGAAVTYVPVLIVIGALPVNVAGFGPVQAAWVAIFAPWEDGARILAFVFLWHGMLLAAVALRGVAFLRATVADVAGRAGETDP